MRRRWLLIVLVLLLGAFAARYVSLGPGGHHRFDIGGEVQELPLISPTILGWVLPGGQARIESAQFSPDGRWMFLSSTRGEHDQLASVTLTWPQDGVVLVEVRLITTPSAGGTDIGIPFGTRVLLDRPLFDEHPPITMDVSTGRPVVVDTYLP